MMFLQFKLLFLKTMQNFKHAIYRNSLILKVTSITFFIVLLISIIFTISIYNFFPEQINNLSSITESLFNYEDIPAPYTWDFFSFIFLNNSGHFWNPIRMLVWIPFLGPLLLVFEIILNSGLIGVIAVMVGINEGITYPIIGLVPHGIVEIPAFLLQLSSIILWQTIITEALISKLNGKKIVKDRITQGLLDVLVLGVYSIILLFIAAIIETYFTPYFLGI